MSDHPHTETTFSISDSSLFSLAHYAIANMHGSPSHMHDGLQTDKLPYGEQVCHWHASPQCRLGLTSPAVTPATSAVRIQGTFATMAMHPK